MPLPAPEPRNRQPGSVNGPNAPERIRALAPVEVSDVKSTRRKRSRRAWRRRCSPITGLIDPKWPNRHHWLLIGDREGRSRSGLGDRAGRGMQISLSSPNGPNRPGLRTVDQVQAIGRAGA
jgi:hypothetical protein